MCADSTTLPPKRSWGERLKGLRNFQSQDFWAMVFARPLTILFLLPVAEIRWVTPTLLTWASVVAKVAGIAYLAACPSYGAGIAGAALVNLGLILDNMDGTLARYRGTSTYLGYYLDKTVDIVCLAGIFFAIGYRTFGKSGDLVDLVMPMAAFAGASIAAYTKWVAQRVFGDVELQAQLRAGTLEEYARAHTEKNPSEEPPARTLGQWLAWFAKAVKSILYFNEVDIFFFLGLALVLDNEQIFARYICAAYTLGALVGPAHFYFKLKSRLKETGQE